MLKLVLQLCLVMALANCASPAKELKSATSDAGMRAVGQSQDPTYGFTEENPVKVGGHDLREGPIRERAFLNSIKGPHGQNLMLPF